MATLESHSAILKVMAGEPIIRPALNPLGVRIVLDLSEFGVRPERRLRCVYLSHDKFTTVKDFKRDVRKNVLKTDAKIQLFLNGKFWVPNIESIQVFQVIVVIRPQVKLSLKMVHFRTMM